MEKSIAIICGEGARYDNLVVCGNGRKIQHHVPIRTGVELEDDEFCGPSRRSRRRRRHGHAQ